MNRQIIEIGKFLSFILRHEPQAIGITLDNDGWTDIDALILAAPNAGKQISRELLHTLLSNPEEKRFAVSADGRRIRAVAGHAPRSIAIDDIARQPPALLYHGTAARFMANIRRHGLLPGSRHHVHLFEEPARARETGLLHGRPVVLAVRALEMHDSGFPFYQAADGVWLTKSVPFAMIGEAGSIK
jgi:putative RNA 2'-phosphotransferase